MLDAIKAGYNGKMEPEYQYKAINRGEDDIGGTYVEISLDDQRLWLYKDYKEILSSPLVSGNPNKGNATPRGSVWAFDCHKSPAVLGTLDTMGYSSPVNYWMAFEGNYGLHDADGWRSSYGGEIYLTNGSHGCVNLPLNTAKVIYQTLNVGYPCVIY